MNYEFGMFILNSEHIIGVGSLITKRGRLVGVFLFNWCLGVEVS